MGAVPVWALAQCIWPPPDVLASEDLPGNDPWWFRYTSTELVRTTDMNKSQLRVHYRRLRSEFAANLSEGERRTAFSNAPTPLKQYFQPNRIVAAYVPVGSEADPSALLRQAHKAGCKTALPYVTSRAAPMQFLGWSPGDALSDGPFDLKQPDRKATPCRPDVILVPLVAFDSRLMRLGQGAGHYDRALSLLDGAFVVGIAWSIQQAPALPADPWDIPLDAILTEKAWIEP